MAGLADLVCVIAVLERSTGVAGSVATVKVVLGPVTGEAVRFISGVARETGRVAVDALLSDVVTVLFDLTEHAHGEQIVSVRAGIVTRRTVLVGGSGARHARGVTRVAVLVRVVAVVLGGTGDALTCGLLEVV